MQIFEMNCSITDNSAQGLFAQLTKGYPTQSTTNPRVICFRRIIYHVSASKADFNFFLGVTNKNEQNRVNNELQDRRHNSVSIF